MQSIIKGASRDDSPLGGSFGRRVLLLWVLASISAYTLLFVLASLGQRAGHGLGMMSLAVGVFIPGIAQWIVLHRYLPGITWPRWLSATLIGQS